MKIYKIILGIPLDGSRYGIEFFKGVGQTDNELIANKLKAKGILVEEIQPESFSYGQEQESDTYGEETITESTPINQEIETKRPYRKMKQV